MTTDHIHNWNDTCDVRYTCPLQRKQECVCGATRYVEIPDSGIPVVKLSDEELKQYLMKKWSSILDKNVSDIPMSVLIESQQKELISDTESRIKNKMDAMTQIPESIAKQPLDPNADYSQRTELVDQALNLAKKVFAELKNKN